jgi:hypothetical protein
MEARAGQSFRVKVRKKTYLWGGEGVKKAPKNLSGLFLHFRVDEEGEPITFGTRTISGKRFNEEEYGELQPGECCILALRDLAGIFALCEDPKDSNVDCVLVTSASVAEGAR